jgi:uncharacterized protein (TIGR02246 family)
MWRRILIVVALTCFPGFDRLLPAQDKPTQEMIDVGNLNEAYVAAFNAQQHKKLAALFASRSDFTLLTGLTVHGRAQTVMAHAAFFKNNPGAKIEGKQLTYRLIRPGVVLASGNWKVTGGPSEYPSSGQWYTVVVNKDGKWRYEAMRLMIPVKKN